METSVKDLFVRFIGNTCTAEEKAQVLGMIRSGGFEAEWEAALLATEHLATDKIPQHPLDESLLYRQIKSKAGIKTVPSISWLKWTGYAASLTIVASLAYIFLKKQTITAPVKQQAVAVAPVKSHHRWIKLADGTSVHLNDNSRLIYPASFAGKKNREVTLIGEAYFDVKHQNAHPFIIHTGNINTTVLGTAFNISAYRAAVAVTVTVNRGKVMVQKGKQTIAVLTPNQQLAWTAQNQTPVKETVNASQALVWAAGDLIMDDITLETAAAMISKRYGVKVEFKNDKVRACRFTAAFLNRNDLNQVLRVVGEISGATLELKNGTVFIDGPGC